MLSMKRLCSVGVRYCSTTANISNEHSVAASKRYIKQVFGGIQRQSTVGDMLYRWMQTQVAFVQCRMMCPDDFLDTKETKLVNEIYDGARRLLDVLATSTISGDTEELKDIMENRLFENFDSHLGNLRHAGIDVNVSMNIKRVQIYKAMLVVGARRGQAIGDGTIVTTLGQDVCLPPEDVATQYQGLLKRIETMGELRQRGTILLLDCVAHAEQSFSLGSETQETKQVLHALRLERFLEPSAHDEYQATPWELIDFNDVEAGNYPLLEHGVEHAF